MKQLEILGAIYQEAFQSLTNCFNRARSVPAGSAGDVLKILYDNVRQVGDVARAINAVREVEHFNAKKAEKPAEPTAS